MKHLKLFEDIFDDFFQDFEEEDWTGKKMKIEIDDKVINITDILSGEYLPTLITNKGHEYYVADSEISAGRAAKKYWAEMDKQELTEMIGKEAIQAWAVGDWYAPGSIEVNSFEDWLDIHLNYPEDTFAIYDGDYHYITNCTVDIIKTLGFEPTVGYRKE